MIPRLRIELISLGETITREKFDSLKNLPVSAILWDFFSLRTESTIVIQLNVVEYLKPVNKNDYLTSYVRHKTNAFFV